MAEPLTFQTAIDNLVGLKGEIWQAFVETLIMLGISTFFAVVLGTVIGIILFITSKNQMAENKWVYRILGNITNLMRAFPFVILNIVMIPFIRLSIGTSIGPIAASFALSIAGAFYFARLVEQNLRDVPRGIIEAAQSMGAKPTTIISKVLLNECRSSLILSITTLVISLLAYSAAAGMIGGGGLGDLAIRYGYNRYQNEVMIFIVIFLLLMVIIIQYIGDKLAMALDKR